MKPRMILLHVIKTDLSTNETQTTHHQKPIEANRSDQRNFMTRTNSKLIT